MFMKINSWLFLLTLLLPTSLFASGKLVIGIRGNEAATQRYVREFRGSVLAEDLSREFEDEGGTDVRIISPITNREVTILLPLSLTPNTLMEALIKTRIARQNGAARILIESPVALSTIPVLGRRGENIRVPVESMFAVAGARFARENKGTLRALSPEPMWTYQTSEPTKSVIFGDDHPELRDEIAKLMRIPTLNRDVDLPAVQIFYLAPFTRPANEVFFKQMADVRELVQRGARLELVTPYLPYARSDRMSHKTGTTVVGRLVADLIESVGISSITFIRAHAAQSEGFFRVPTFHLSEREIMVPILRKLGVTVVLSPDAGAVKDATLYADDLDAALAIINKQRDPDSKAIKIVGMTPAFLRGRKVSIERQVVLIPDDETESGSTGDRGGARVSKRRPKKVIFFVVHPRGRADAARTSKFIDTFIVMNTLPIPEVHREGIARVVSVAPLIASKLKELRVSTNSRDGCKTRLRALKGRWIYAP
jgi:ribose-phosphate pyrophosphokinase